jgi:predicted nucleic acid-binding protein
VDDYWQTLLRHLRPYPLYVDTGAILACFEPDNDTVRQFINTNAGYRLVTSTYVLTEAVRRLVKSRAYKFIGPNREQQKALSLYLLREWLEEHNVVVTCVPESVFNEAKQLYQERQHVDCDLTDIISYTIVSRLKQRQILSPDQRHLRELGLQCLP